MNHPRDITPKARTEAARRRAAIRACLQKAIRVTAERYARALVEYNKAMELCLSGQRRFPTLGEFL